MKKEEQNEILKKTEHDDKNKNAMRDCLIWMRDNIVNGNENHVKTINQALGEH